MHEAGVVEEVIVSCDTEVTNETLEEGYVTKETYCWKLGIWLL